MTGTTLSLVGATGGAGTTRLTVECAGTLARTGRDVAVLDAAFGTQGLRRYIGRRPQPDFTAVLAGDAALDSALLPLELATPGGVAVAPAHAPFERLARAKTASAARELERAISTAAAGHDVVLVDTPPVAANQALAAVSASDRTAVVTPDSDRGRDGLALVQSRLRDVAAGVDAILATDLGADRQGESNETATGLHEQGARIPPLAGGPVAAPTTVDPTADGAPAVAAALRVALGLDVEVPSEPAEGLGGLLPGR
jgi:cellulose biosynthesis protein BcsQ